MGSREMMGWKEELIPLGGHFESTFWSYSGFVKSENEMPNIVAFFLFMAWLAISEEGRCCFEW
jgi:hypothetical protein